MRATTGITARATKLRRAALWAGGVLVLAACNPTEILDVTDPDIINPSDVSSPAGANAVRLGALARLNAATSGEESLFMLGGLFADEWNNGDTFIARQEIDQRVITPENTFLTAANRVLHRARVGAQQAVALLQEFSPNAPAADVAEMYFVQAFVENMMAEHYCNGLVFSTFENGAEQLGSGITTTAAFEMALAHADAGLKLITGNTAADQKVRNALAVTKGRILVNLARYAEAATAVAGVPTTFKYDMQHAITATSNQMWNWNNLSRRYSVSTNEGGNGLDFATANDPRLPVCVGGDATCKANGVTQPRRDDSGPQTLYVQLKWPVRESPVTISSGVEARLTEAEAQLKAGNAAGALATLNALRATVTGLAPLTLAATPAAQLDQLFRERAFWMFSTGHRTGDLRRLVRQYGRAATSVFPVGPWHKGGNYGTDVTIPVPQAEENNPNVTRGATCMDRNA
ncbi:MAG TPA: RagB/SusD family nutrient uptake outer membrane protein [Gemmatimonadaceae bacterium]